MYKMFDPTRGAFTSLDADKAKQFVASAEEVKAQLIADGELNADGSPVAGNK
jgi:hypothetical protein